MTQQPSRARRITLAGVVGTGAAMLLLTNIPTEESGRRVKVEIAQDGTATVRHLSGRQYLRAYLDIVGVATACDGITRGVRMGQTYTEAQCAELLERELIIHAQGVMRCTPGLHGPGTDGIRFAAVDLAYNNGVEAYCGSTMRRLLNAGQFRAACEQLPRWNKVRQGGRMVPNRGLTARRARAKVHCDRDANR